MDNLILWHEWTKESVLKTAISNYLKVNFAQ